MHVHQRLSLILLAATLGLAQAAPAYPEYRVTVVGPANSRAADINSAGVVVGSYPYDALPTRGFVYRGKGWVGLGTLGGSASNAVAINDKGQVLGNWTTSGGQQRGYIYYQGKQRDIGAVRGKIMRFTDINNAGYVTASGDSPDLPPATRAYLRTPAGSFRDLGNLNFPDYDAPTLNTALALNNRNQVAGESGPFTFPEQPLRATLWGKGVLRDLGDFGWAPNGGVAINDKGQVTGYMSVPIGLHSRVAFIYSNGRLIDIDGRGASAPDRSSAGAGINNHGHVVGSSDHLSGFLYRGRRMESLNALVDPKGGWDIFAPQAINDAGQIAATARRRGVAYAVRLDLIRPSALAAPALEPDAELEAQAGEVVQPDEQ
jgi:probable HAF family extracellular repeat protein